MGKSEIIAQKNDTIRIITEGGYIEKMNNKIAVDVSVNNLYETFEVKTPDDKFIIHPNSPAKLKFKVNYRIISLSVQFAPGNGNKDTKGKTKTFKLGTSLIFNHFFFDFSYSKVRGYYLKNTEDYIPWKKGDQYIQFPDLNYTGFEMALGYFNNTRFSFRSLTSQTERQLKSAGSFIPVFNFRYFILNDKSSSLTTQKSNNIETSIGPGYAHTFVVKQKVYFSLGATTSLGYLHTKLTTRQPTGNILTNQDNFIFRWDAKAGLGYNGRMFYSGAYANVSGTEYKQQNTTAINAETRVFYHIFFGVRFKSPAFIDKEIDKLESLKHKFP